MKSVLSVSSLFLITIFGFQMGSISPSAGASQPRIRGREGFSVEEVYSPAKSGSVVAMTFDSRGRLVFSREKDPVFVLLDEDRDGRAEGEQMFTDFVTNCQGLHFYRDDLLAVGDGPEGPGLYRVIDKNGDGKGDRVVTLARFTRRMGEHGPHAVFFGPEGFLYVVLGNHTGLVATPDPLSPHKDYIEGQLLPTYTDPRGHARDIRAPGGTIVRLNLDAKDQDWQMFAGGFRNAYDAAFNLLGELFTLDSDMEWDIDLPWFRPVRTNHIVPGGEYGWRTGSGKRPEYYPDSLPAMTNVGRGSPAGLTFYQHYAYPREYYDSFIQGDWSRGRILVGFLQQSGATYTEKSQEFVLGEPLNVTDLEVGPDGLLYFSKGGRFTEGGIYRVVYGRKVKGQGIKRNSLLARSLAVGNSIGDALTQPQPRSAWSRAKLLKTQARMGRKWGRDLVKEVRRSRSSPERRVRALELLEVYGPDPSERFLTSLGKDRQWEVRAASAYYLGLHKSDSARRELIRRLKNDSHPFVRRRACEALIRTEIHPGMNLPISPRRDLFPLLKESDRFLRYTARQVLPRVNRNKWRDDALKLDDYPAVTEALLALVQTVRGTNDVPFLLERELELLDAHPDDDDLRGLLRVIHLTMINDEGVNYSEIYESMGELLMSRFPTQNQSLNREIALTLAHLETPGAISKILQQLENPQTHRQQQIFYTYCLRAFKQGWESEEKDAVVQWFKKTQEQHWKGGASFLGYLESMWNEFLEVMPPEEKQVAMERVPSLTAQTLDSVEASGLPFRRQNYTPTLSERELEEYLLWDPMSYTGKPENGKPAYEKAFCVNCHIFGEIGREAGPDLSDVGKRFQRKDLIEAILYPSRTISDLWAAVEIVTKDNTSVIGVISREDAESAIMLTAAGFRVTIPKSDVQSRRVSESSLMPEGLLNNLTRREIIDLFAFLEQGPHIRE
ncbi:HEAT repeat domain-containing protein [Acidobacteria bacterium AH-259-O06]|nr:HEAT repeat domain-containing protein [Acidobacteria bacterium AH-259-O06]